MEEFSFIIFLMFLIKAWLWLLKPKHVACVTLYYDLCVIDVGSKSVTFLFLILEMPQSKLSKLAPR
jgi:hypothetical protein